MTDEPMTRPTELRLFLENPDEPPEPLPLDVSIEDALARISPGGQVVLRDGENGPARSILWTAGDPRLKAYEAGVRQGRREISRAGVRASVTVDVQRTGAGEMRMSWSASAGGDS